MSDDDLIRRRDAEDKVCPFLKSEFAEDAIAAIRAIPATDAREKALREAAAIASKLAAQWWSEYKNVGHEKAYSTHHEGMSDGADEVATAILRALEEEARDV